VKRCVRGTPGALGIASRRVSQCRVCIKVCHKVLFNCIRFGL
jgi:hypothetical protein